MEANARHLGIAFACALCRFDGHAEYMNRVAVHLLMRFGLDTQRGLSGGASHLGLLERGAQLVLGGKRRVRTQFGFVTTRLKNAHVRA